LELKEVAEKNYFFKLTNYKAELEANLLRAGSTIPEWRRDEALAMVRELEDISISREKEKLPWGVPVPGDESQVMYVWFDALTNYISTLGWPNEEGDFEKFWKNAKTVQVAGKDQVRFQSVIFQGMLLSAGIKPTDTIFYHGFITSGGKKMSKSLGNVISPYDLVKKYGTDATRYLLRHVHSTEDSDVTWEKLDEWYTAGLVNGIGNLVARVMQMAEKNLESPIPTSRNKYPNVDYGGQLAVFDFQAATNIIWAYIQGVDETIQANEPFKLVKANPEKGRVLIGQLVEELAVIGEKIQPFMPETSEKILKAVRENKKPENLFPRLG
jgi:methionyl-tRNA synthetase